MIDLLIVFTIILLSYIIGIICWGFVIFLCDSEIYTYEDLLREMLGSPAFIPVINIITFIGCLVCFVTMFLIKSLYKGLFINKLWDKIKTKRIRR